MLADGTAKALLTSSYLRRLCIQANDCEVNMAYSSTKCSSTPVPQQNRSKATCMPVKKCGSKDTTVADLCSTVPRHATHQHNSLCNTETQSHTCNIPISVSGRRAAGRPAEPQPRRPPWRARAPRMPPTSRARPAAPPRTVWAAAPALPISVGWQGRWSTRCLRVRRASEGLQPRLAPASGGAAAATRWPCKG